MSTEERTPDEWCVEFNVMILDPDGWRGADDPPFTQPISRREFQRRLAMSTIGPRDWLTR
jgi:hypothetical protein